VVSVWKFEFVFVFFPALYQKKKKNPKEQKAYLPTHSKNWVSAIANR
jgi:hypothetical protein